MAKSTRRSPSPPGPSGPGRDRDGGGGKGRRAGGRAPAAPPAFGGDAAALADDLIDVEAPPGSVVDTAAYAAPGSGSGPASASEVSAADDLIDVEAPPTGGAAVDTAAYAAAGRKPKARKRDAEPSTIAGAPPPPPPPPVAPDEARADDGDPLDGEAGGAPPPAGPELGGGPPPSAVPATPGDLLERAGLAALRLAAERPWPQVSLRDIAGEAGAPFAELYAAAPGKPALLLALSARLDRAALERIEGDGQPAARDRLFEAVMSRLEVMAPHRDALLAIARSERTSLALAPALPRTVRALLEGAGVDTAGGRGALRVAATLGVWARTLQVWRDDEGALNRTMAEIDKLLTQADKRLSRVGAGF